MISFMTEGERRKDAAPSMAQQLKRTIRELVGCLMY
jgi:hypothetical protein